MSDIDTFLNFLFSIDLSYSQSSSTINSLFTPHCSITKGILVFDDNAYIHDLIHEAGHLAILPEYIRKEVSGDVDKEVIRIIEEKDIDYDERLIYANEQAAIGWSFYVCQYLGLNEEYAVMGLESSEVAEGALSQLRFGLSTPLGSIYSCQLFYLGLLAFKNSKQLLAWTI